MVSGAARGCQFPLNLTNLAHNIVEATLDDAPHERGAFLHGGRSAGVAGEGAAGFLEAEKALRRLRVHKKIPALIHALRPTILQHQKGAQSFLPPALTFNCQRDTATLSAVSQRISLYCEEYVLK